jgi:hypothetical protein
MAVLDQLKVFITVDGVPCQEYGDDNIQSIETEVVELDGQSTSDFDPESRESLLRARSISKSHQELTSRSTGVTR